MLKQSLKEFTDLTQHQRAAVMTEHNRVAVVACPGSGKTTVLTRRIQWLLSKGVSPYKICALTFTNKASDEMRERLEKTTTNGKQVTCKTFHGFGLKVIRDFGNEIGLPRNPTIYDDQDRDAIVAKIMQETGLKASKKQLRSAYDSRFKDTHYWDHDDSKLLVTEYTSRMKAQGALDFDMIIMEAVNVLVLHIPAGQFYHDRYEYILIDEAQDTDKLQHEMVSAINPQNLFYVADIDQCIYEWRSAKPRLMIEILANPSFETHALEESHRCTYEIATVANNVIRNNVNRYEKDIQTKKAGGPVRWLHFPSRYKEAEFIWDYVGSLIDDLDVKPEEIFVLARTNRFIKYLEKVYHEKGRDYTLDTTAENADLWKSLPVRAMVSTLKLIANPSSTYLAETSVFAMRRGYDIDTMTYRSIQQGHSLCKELMDSDSWMSGFMEVDADSDVFEVTNRLIHYLAETLNNMSLTNQLPIAWDFVNFVFNWRADRDSSTVQSFLDWLAARSLQDTIDFDKESVKLMTVHAAKGLEAEYVIIAGLEDEVFPSRRSDIEEERRLFYVAATRAKDKLVLCYQDEQPSQFIEEADD